MTDPGSVLSERPVCASEGRIRGTLPLGPFFGAHTPGRTARIANPLPDRSLARLRMTRGRANRVSLAHQECLGPAFPPKQRAEYVSPARPQPERCGRGHDDSANCGRDDGGHGRVVPAPRRTRRSHCAHGFHPRQSSLFPPWLMGRIGTRSSASVSQSTTQRPAPEEPWETPRQVHANGANRKPVPRP